jgi:tRNA nucleotidyltransferase/poly(A) polymerase
VTDADDFMASLDLPEVYRVGGSVRDELLGRPSRDYDDMVRGASIEQITEALLKAEVRSVRPLKLRDARQVGVRFAHAWGLTEVVLPRKEVSTGPGHRDFHMRSQTVA